MNFDLKPGQYRKVKAKDHNKLILEIYGYKALYQFKYSDGFIASVMFSPNTLKSFQPNKTVSQMMDRWQQTIIYNIKVYKEALRSGIHPYWTTDKLPQASDLITRNTFDIGRTKYSYPQKITRSQREYYKKEIKKLQARSGKLICEVITT